jgi:hypothetical protein
MCNGAREYACWNAITFDGPFACKQLTSTVFASIETLPSFEPDFLQRLGHEIENSDSARAQQIDELNKLELRLTRKIDNISEAISDSGHSQALLTKLAQLESERDDVCENRREIERTPRRQVAIPSIEEIKSLAKQKFADLASDSPEFARLMSQLVPSIIVHPFRLCDGGHPVLRACVRLDAACLVQDAAQIDGLREQLSRDLVVDLFEPPQRAAVLADVVRLTQSPERLTERQIGERLGVTQPAVQNAKKLDRIMQQRVLVNPYVLLQEPPQDYSKLRRHHHKRYQFAPLDGYPLKWPT